MATEVLVCQASSCRRRGSEAVFAEIEELAAGLQCLVRESGCLGMCNQAPAALVVKSRKETPFTRLCQLESSAKVVEFATGRPSVAILQGQTPAQRSRLEDARAQRARQHASRIFKWNSALNGLLELVAKKERYDEKRIELEMERAALWGKAGFWQASLQAFSELEGCVQRLLVTNFQSSDDFVDNAIEIMLEKVKVLGKMGRRSEVEQVRQQLQATAAVPGTPIRLRMEEVKGLLANIDEAIKEAGTTADTQSAVESGVFGVAAIEQYSLWTVQSFRVVSAHSAVFRFISKDRKRGTPHPRGSGKVAQPITWHTTLLAQKSSDAAEEEGPLPWIERDYTPTSSAKEWESGKCDILIKIYTDGVATSWLQKQLLSVVQVVASGEEPKQLCYAGKDFVQLPSDLPVRVWLSKPLQTLSVPGLVPEDAEAFRPGSVLLVLAGTGIVALPQILAHRDPYGKLNLPTKKSEQMRVPIDVVFSCRRDDILMLGEITQWCQEALENDQNSRDPPPFRGIRHCTLLLTEPVGAGQSTPFSTAGTTFESDQAAELELFSSLPNSSLVYGRVSLELLAESVSKMPQMCRVVVSGPAGFNTTVRELLLSSDMVREPQLTILTA
mmetsp:Transcript_64437/g.119858  ORF Transcript_64437/g.119858 Transcript_64437/m.119858 type:complete len:613 (+) Transcript_64437:101-1939(+)